MRTICLLPLLVSLVWNAPAAEQAATPEALVADVYKSNEAGNSPFLLDKGRALADRYFARELVDLMVKDAKRAGDEVGAIDFDPLHDTQDDLDIKKFVIGKAEVKRAKAVVKVSFENHGEKVLITLHCKQEDGAWKITDIAYHGGEYSLMKLLKEAGN